MRFSGSFDPSDLEESIQVMERGLRLMPPEDRLSRSSLLFDLSNALDMRFAESDDMSDLQRSITAMGACVDGVAPTKRDQELRLITLAGRLRAKFNKTGAVVDVQDAIDLIQRAVDGTSEPKTRARNLSTVGFLNVLAYEKTGGLAYLDRAIQALHSGLGVGYICN
jgi:hypothetical protein